MISLFWHSYRISNKLSLEDNRRILDWCYETFGLPNTWRRKELAANGGWTVEYEYRFRRKEDYSMFLLRWHDHLQNH